jgi:phage terminase small subunit
MTTQLQFELDKPAEAQTDKVLEYLTRFRNMWVHMPELAKYCGGYAVHSRVADLRKRGYIIDNMVDRSKKPYNSFYRLRT